MRLRIHCPRTAVFGRVKHVRCHGKQVLRSNTQELLGDETLCSTYLMIFFKVCSEVTHVLTLDSLLYLAVKASLARDNGHHLSLTAWQPAILHLTIIKHLSLNEMTWQSADTIELKLNKLCELSDFVFPTDCNYRWEVTQNKQTVRQTKHKTSI